MEYIDACRLNHCCNDQIINMVSFGSGKHNTQSELVINLLMQEVI